MGPAGEGIKRRPPERLAAWLVTGPLGHLYGALADLTGLGAANARRRWGGRRALRRGSPRHGTVSGEARGGRSLEDG